ncbi:MAG: Ig-like domain-containing protein, partial [Planctomycetes bacterium]|nr:Ig-like domain-containing protein [Planctomycetota bacterium]
VSNAACSAGRATCVATGTATITALHAGSGVSDGTVLTVTPAVLTSLAVTPTHPSIALGTTQQFTATGTYTDSSIQDLTAAVTWSSSAPGVATVSNAASSEGRATSVAIGTTTITAVHAGSGVSDNTMLTVTPAVLTSLAVTPTHPSIALGTTQQFTATGTYTDSSTQDLTAAVTWSSSATGVATISNAGGSEGRATSVATGTTTITAVHAGSGVSDNTMLTVTPATLVSIAVTPTTPTISVGATQQFTATGTYTDSSTQDLTTAVTWSSSATGVATVSNAGGSQGRATGVAGGTATITALHAGSGASGNTVLTVRPDIQLRAAASAGAASGVLALTVPTPTGALTGDVLLAAIAVRPNTAAVTPPTGWTLVRRIDNAMAAAHSLLVYHRVVMAGEPANHSWTFSASTGSAGGIVAFVNVDTGNIVDVEDGQNTASGVVHTAPSVTTTVAGTMLVTLHAFSSSATWTSPPAMSEAFDVASEALGATGISMSGHYVLRPTAGATGTRAATASNDADVGNTASIALRRSP